jgi:RecA-family ATPase
MPMQGNAEAAREWMEENAPPAEEQWPPTREELAATDEEMHAANLAPRCIVEQYLFADVAQIVSPGGTGKTTLLLYEAACIALGRKVWGLEVKSRGWTLFCTKEDQREIMLARLREIMNAMDLNADERRRVREGVIVLDVTGTDRKLTRVTDGNIIMTTTADDIIEAYRDDPPAVVIFDPLVSFGASEAMVNDNEQGLVDTARRIVKGLGCCVRYVHHTGKANARAASTDQYSGRGGTALPDGSRMTAVLEAWDRKEIPPQGCTPGTTSSVVKLHRHKLSYAPPNLPTIWIQRDGYEFEHFLELKTTPEQQAAAQQDQLERFLESRVKDGEYHTTRTLDDTYKSIQMSRGDGRAALAILKAQGRVLDVPLPKDKRQGRKQTFCCPVELAAQYGAVGEK